MSIASLIVAAPSLRMQMLQIGQYCLHEQIMEWQQIAHLTILGSFVQFTSTGCLEEFDKELHRLSLLLCNFHVGLSLSYGI